MVRIENWSVAFGRGDKYLPPELEPVCLHGKVFGHPRFTDGEEITTSPIVGYDKEAGIVVCKSRQYRLGAINPDYEAKFPNAREKFIKTWSRQQVVN